MGSSVTVARIKVPYIYCLISTARGCLVGPGFSSISRHSKRMSKKDDFGILDVTMHTLRNHLLIYRLFQFVVVINFMTTHLGVSLWGKGGIGSQE